VVAATVTPYRATLSKNYPERRSGRIAFAIRLGDRNRYRFGVAHNAAVGVPL
jgi:hypothetical protein